MSKKITVYLADGSMQDVEADLVVISKCPDERITVGFKACACDEPTEGSILYVNADVVAVKVQGVRVCCAV